MVRFCHSENIFLQKKAYYAQVEAITFVKKDKSATLQSKFNNWLKKAGLMRTPQQLTLNVMKFSPRDYQRILTILANKRQAKHTFTVLEPSIPFHMLFKTVDAEDIANDKISTHVLL